MTFLYIFFAFSQSTTKFDNNYMLKYQRKVLTKIIFWLQMIKYIVIK